MISACECNRGRHGAVAALNLGRSRDEVATDGDWKGGACFSSFSIRFDETSVTDNGDRGRARKCHRRLLRGGSVINGGWGYCAVEEEGAGMQEGWLK